MTEAEIRKEERLKALRECKEIATEEYLFHETPDFMREYDKGGSSAAWKIKSKINAIIDQISI